MLIPLAAVVVYSNEYVDSRRVPRPAFCVVAHNLERFDAFRLSERLRKQYELDAFVVHHRIRHDLDEHQQAITDPGDCPYCGSLFETVIEDAIRLSEGVTTRELDLSPYRGDISERSRG